MDEVIILHDNLCAGPREVERERLLGAAEVVELEDEMLGEITNIAPDNPTYTGSYQTVFVS